MTEHPFGWCPLIRQAIRSIAQLLLGLLAVPLRCVQIFMPENLGQRHQVAGIVFKELVRHRVPQQVWMQFDAAKGAVLVADGPDALVAERSSFPDEHAV